MSEHLVYNNRLPFIQIARDLWGLKTKCGQLKATPIALQSPPFHPNCLLYLWGLKTKCEQLKAAPNSPLICLKGVKIEEDMSFQSFGWKINKINWSQTNDSP